jgi:hypothetical protein
MIFTPHAVAGAAIGILIPNPWLAVPVAIASHYALDSLLHWQETLAPYEPTRRTYARIALDIPAGIALVALFSHWNPGQALTIWLGAGAALLPDIDSFLVFWPGLRRFGPVQAHWDWHCRIQRETDKLGGLWTQAGVVALAVIIAHASSVRR